MISYRTMNTAITSIYNINIKKRIYIIVYKQLLLCREYVLVFFFPSIETVEKRIRFVRVQSHSTSGFLRGDRVQSTQYAAHQFENSGNHFESLPGNGQNAIIIHSRPILVCGFNTISRTLWPGYNIIRIYTTMVETIHRIQKLIVFEFFFSFVYFNFYKLF